MDTLKIPFKRVISFYFMSVCLLVCMYVHSVMCLVPSEARRGKQILKKGSYRWL